MMANGQQFSAESVVLGGAWLAELKRCVQLLLDQTDVSNFEPKFEPSSLLYF
jgi:hypothetical protein